MICAKFGIIVIANNDLAMGGRDLWITLYKHVKLDFGFESYLCMYNSSLRVSITRLRLSSHLFLIERGRWGRNRLEYKDRVCIYIV